MTSSRVEFSKWHGLGNDYVIVAAADIPFDMTPKRAAALCDRHFGIGADGILLWSTASGGGFRLDIFNPDGSKAEMCGNGIRMLARYLVDRGYTTNTTLSIATGAGTITPTVHPDGQVRVHMGKAKLGGSGIIGYEGDWGKSEAIDVKLEIAGKEYEFTYVNVGNPHCVIETQNLDDIDLEFLGRSIENHRLFPNRTNVEFMKIIGANEVAMRVWERGVGETSACGTGACAVAVAAYRTRGVESPVTVHLPGGDLYIEVNPQMEVYMTGPAEEIYSGVLSEDYINRIKEL